MNRFMFGYCATIISALLWPTLLTHSIALLAILTVPLLWKWSKLLAGSLLAMAWISLFCHQLFTSVVEKNGESSLVRGEIISLVYRNSDWISADIRLINANSINYFDRYMRLQWQTEQKVAIGEQWLFEIRPKSITSPLNQGGFNQQRYLLSKHIIGKARVVQASKLADSHGIRSGLIEQLRQDVIPLDNGDFIMALMLGDKQLISRTHWQGLRQSGTGHLIAISGLHLSVLALWVIGVGGFLLVRWRPAAGMSNRQITACMALLCCGGFAYLSGLSLPTQRALVMLVLVVVLGVARRYASPFERLLWALFVVLLFDPLSVLSAGLWLSFGALAIILWLVREPLLEDKSSMWQRIKNKLSQLWRVQWRLSIGLAGLQVVLFGGLAPYALLFNLFFVPWFSLVVIPLTFVVLLLWCLCFYFGLEWRAPLIWLDAAIDPLSTSFSVLEFLPLYWVSAPANLLAGLMLMAAAFVVVRLAEGWWRYLAMPLALPLCLHLMLWMVPVSSKRWQVHMLDVGQGLSVVIEKQGRAIVYDTGAAFGHHFSYAERVLIPFVDYRGIGAIDYLVLSHGDNDHAGGAATLMAYAPDVQVITDLDYQEAIDCRPKTLNWQGLKVAILGPVRVAKGNNGSCIVRVSDGTHQLLLPGDIELAGERALLASMQAQGVGELLSKVVIAPHHGSNTSSSRAFIQATSPEVVLYAAGFNNRYGFPKPEVIRRYQLPTTQQYSVGTNGQLSLMFSDNTTEIKGYRRDFAPFWYNRLFQFGEFDNTE